VVRNPDTAFFGHPAGLSTLFFTEMWERFSYYGMRAILILFMTAPVAMGGLGFDTARAGVIYGLYTGSVYMLALPGGWMADRLLGLRRAVFLGGVVIMTGHILLAVPTLWSFYLGLVCVAVGTGLLKPNISALVGTLYAPEDVRRDAGFSIYYMGINLGAFLAPLATGWLAQSDQFRRTLAGWGFAPEGSWHWGFAAAAVGMFLGLCQYVLGGRALGDAGKAPGGSATPAHLAAAWRKFGMGAGSVFALIALVAVLSAGGTIVLTAEAIGRVFDWVLVLTVLGFFGWLFLGKGWSVEERKRLVVIFVLFLGAAVFWSAFEQAGSTLNLFAERSTRTRLLGFDFPASWFQSLNPLFIILLAPVFAWLWVALGKRDPSSPAKFALGLFLLALGFGVMIGAAAAAGSGELVSPLWLFCAYLLHTTGELCLSPVGLSAMTRLAPARVAGLMMGVWFLASAVGNYIAGRIASFYETFSREAIFTAVTGYALLAAVVMALLIRPIRRMLAR
jgi:POT family proton-dependent oligopeptide transporter